MLPLARSRLTALVGYLTAWAAIACTESPTGTTPSPNGQTAGAGLAAGSGSAGDTSAPSGGGGAAPTSLGGASSVGATTSAGTSAVAGGAGSVPGPLPGDPTCALYAAPNGNGSACSAQAPCSLTGARDRARTLNRNLQADLEVCLSGGTYWLNETFVLSEVDSGSNGKSVVYRAIFGENPVLSGGRAITGFTVHDAAKNIFVAPATGLTSRQLFVNGARAVRARSEGNFGMTRGEHGFHANTTELASWKNLQQVEVTGELDWRHYRCPVAAVTGDYVELQSPCWELSQDIPGGWWQFKEVNHVENAYELLDQEGEFYLDQIQGLLFYKPRANEDLATAEVVAPVLETLVHGQGTPAKPLHHVAFRGLTFAHGTWHQPSTAVGYTSWQAGFLHRTLGQYYDSGFFPAPSNLVFEAANDLVFEGNRFEHLGANGLHLYRAAARATLVGNRFEDISGRALTIGHIDDYAVPEGEVVRDHVVRNNYFLSSGVEYRDCPIVFIGYTRGTKVEHNWLRGGPYSGISLGWGWANHPESTAGNNLIRFNRIEDFMKYTFDGSGVYALGPQRGSSVDHNYIYRGLPRGEGIFPDQGASYMTWEWNVIEDVGYQWIHDWSSQAHHNIIRHNITNQPNFEHSGGADKNDIFEDNRVIEDGVWPSEALEIKAKAGLEPEYASLAD